MPAGGKWVLQNKVRPGAYINVVGKPKTTSVLGERGTVAVAVPMSWGPQDTLIKLTAEDMLNGNSLAKVGCVLTDLDASLPYRLALAGASTAYIYRADTGGQKAVLQVSTTVTATAKHAGSVGNLIGISVALKDSEYQIDIFVNDALKETFVTAAADVANIESAWVVFSVQNAAALQDISLTRLSGGTNGTVQTETFTAFLAASDSVRWDCLTIASTEPAAATAIIAKIKHLRDSAGRKVQGVVYNDVSADHEGIIAVKQGFKTEIDTVGTNLFPLWVASITAGSNINQSNTLKVVPGATEIIQPVSDENIADNLNKGWFLLSYRQDGAVVIEQDINCLVTLGSEKTYAFRKNRVIRALDELCNTGALIFNSTFGGQIDNTAYGRNIYKSQLISMLEQRQALGAFQNVDGPKDIDVFPGEQLDAVGATIAAQPVDSMEKLYLTINVN